jgi:ElaA protein
MALKYTCYSYQELSKDHLYEIMQLRQEVFVVEQNCPYLDADGKDNLAYHLIGQNDSGTILAYTRLLPKGSSYESFCAIGRVLTSIKIRKQGEGYKLMQKSIELCEELFPNQPIKISAQSHLDKFYQFLGFAPTGEEYLEDDIPHQAMIYKKS